MSDGAAGERRGAPSGHDDSGRKLRARLGRSPDLAAVLAILVPGAGHLYLGRFRAAGGWLVAILVGYWAVFFPGLLLHVISIRAAYRSALVRSSDDAGAAARRA